MEVKVSKGERGKQGGSAASRNGQLETIFDVFESKPAGVSDLIIAQSIKAGSVAGFGRPRWGSEAELVWMRPRWEAVYMASCIRTPRSYETAA